MEHKLKINLEYAIPAKFGDKDWELRKNDRDYQTGDTIEFSVIGTPVKYKRMITYIFHGGDYGLDEGYCIMSLKKIPLEKEVKNV